MDREIRRLQYRRFRRRILSKLKKKKRNGGIPAHEILIRYRFKKVKSGYTPERQLKTPDKTVEVQVPLNFCFRRDHERTMKFLRRIDQITGSRIPCSVKFSHEKTRSIGIAASFHLYSKLIEYKEKWLKKGYEVGYSGKLSKHKTVNNYMLAFGLLKELGVEGTFDSQYVDPDYFEKYYTFKYHGKRSRQSDKSMASAGLANYFSDSLALSGLEVSKSAIAKLTGAFGELIANVEEHSHTVERVWDVLGCYDKETKECHFAIQNFGCSIFKNLSKLKENPTEKIEKVAKAMSKSSVLPFIRGGMASGFGFGNDEEELFWCLLALQDGISSAKKRPGDAPRGQGLMDVLMFIDEVRDKQEHCEIVVISGRAKLILDFSYGVKEFVKDGTLRRTLALNKEGDFALPQDHTKLILLGEEYKGTLITGHFRIAKTYLK